MRPINPNIEELLSRDISQFDETRRWLRCKGDWHAPSNKKSLRGKFWTYDVAKLKSKVGAFMG